ncbi:hypothetical protein FisN_36Hh035 [Fistulifera solaris]|uniref:PPIase cyclophilin-type domain-containing protein n=1 Tax=Fistulifera solaris TaxID=1519565 RepID=A0A1Z5KU24_FISSO|nr:hypothetical protein FisN_36Hh035 [Fistulifera solaris]|eukprot:GAX29541.1 hypothetical protein FisN_36Hh035 [Fistulifera solaris]
MVNSRPQSEMIPNLRLSDSPPSVPKRSSTTTTFRAAESGRGDLLPTLSSSSNHNRGAPNRVRSMSSGLVNSAIGTAASWRNASKPTKTADGPLLRSRPGKRAISNGSMDDGSVASNEREWMPPASYPHDKPPAPRCLWKTPSPSGSSQWIQTLVLLIVTCLVWESYHRAMITSEQFEKLKHDESIIMLHLQGLERKSMQLHEVLGRLSDGTVIQNVNKPNNNNNDEPVDAKLIHVQTQQLYQMEEELQHELKGLQTKLQQVARSSIVGTYGEGPVQVSFDINIGKDTERISISLWYDTPHAAWTLIDQIRSGKWTGSQFVLAPNGATLTALPPEPTAPLDFVETASEKHEAWTVGLAENDAGGLSLFINLQDNSADRKFDVCVGKVVEGFGSLQKLVSSLRSNKPVSVTAASASRVPRGKAAGLFE